MDVEQHIATEVARALNGVTLFQLRVQHWLTCYYDPNVTAEVNAERAVKAVKEGWTNPIGNGWVPKFA